MLVSPALKSTFWPLFNVTVKSSVNGLLNDIVTVPTVLSPVIVPLLDSVTVLPVISTSGAVLSV